MKEDDIIIRPAMNNFIINSYSRIILIKKSPVLLKIKESIAVPFIILIKVARKCQKPLTVFKVLLEDITKASHLKIIRIPTEIRKLLPA